ncbi:MAG TPA: HEAT repeat domain-containing protein [Blastocatellia bacterium]|nr:HEAT repeat domain-containing protein [Blastocatellia bacterium]
MALAASSNLVVRLVWGIDLLLLLTILLLLLLLIAWRFKLMLEASRTERLFSLWEPLLIESLEETLTEVPRVAKRDRLTWLRLWNRFSESLKDPVREKLNHLARMVTMDQSALEFLRKGNRAEKMVAMTALGQLREERAWELLLTLAHQKEPLLSLTAAKALLRIDAERALPLIVSLIAIQEEWSAPGVAAMLREVGPERLTPSLIDAVLNAAPHQAPRLVRYLSLAWPEHTIPVIHQLLSTAQYPETLTACLKLCQDPDMLGVVRQCLGNAHWQVRVQALNALSRMGTVEDIPRVLACLEDEEWWIRYRAAQTLTQLPGMTPERIDELARAQASPYAHDAIQLALAEWQA